MQIHLSIAPRTQRSSVKFIQAKNDLQKKKDEMAKPQARLLPLTGQYVFIVQFDDGPHDIAPFFCKQTYCLRIWIVFTSNALLTVVSLLDMGAGPNLIKMDFLPPPGRNLSNRSYRDNCERRTARL